MSEKKQVIKAGVLQTMFMPKAADDPTLPPIRTASAYGKRKPQKVAPTREPYIPPDLGALAGLVRRATEANGDTVALQVIVDELAAFNGSRGYIKLARKYACALLAQATD